MTKAPRLLQRSTIYLGSTPEAYMRISKTVCCFGFVFSFVLLYAVIPFATHVVDAQNTNRAIQPQAYFTEPALAPDRKEIAFVSGGDIWTVPSTGGVAALLVAHAANEARPLYSPDGKELAFVSNRTG